MKETLKIDATRVSGKYTIIIRDAVTKKVEREIVCKNVITGGVGWANWCRQMSNAANSEGYGGSGVGSIQQTIPNTDDIRVVFYNANRELFNRIYLTDNQDPVDDMTAFVKGNVIGTAWNETVDADMARGYFQRNLSFYTPEKARYVFIFDINRGKGSFNSVFMSRERSATENAVNYIGYSFGANVATAGSGSYHMVRGMVMNGDSVYFVDTNYFYEVNYKTKKLIRRVALSETAVTGTDTCRCQSGLIGNGFYYIAAGNILVRLDVDPSSPTYMQITARSDVSETMFFEYNGNLYCPTHGARTIRRYSADLGTALETITVAATAANFGNNNHRFNYDYRLGRLVWAHSLNSSAIEDFLALGLSAPTTTIFEFNSFSATVTGSAAAILNLFTLENGNALLLNATNSASLTALLQAYKYQGFVGSALLLDAQVEKPDGKEMVVQFDVDFGTNNFIE